MLKLRPVFRRAEIACTTYDTHRPDAQTVVYCDPPYAGTLGYGSSFDTEQFWRTIDQWVADGALVVVSEMAAPQGWGVLAERDRKAMLRVADGGDNQTRREVLFWKCIAQESKFVLRSGALR